MEYNVVKCLLVFVGS